MAAPSTTTAAAAVPDNGSIVTTNAPLSVLGAAAASAAAFNVWPNTRDSYELREVIGNLITVYYVLTIRLIKCISFAPIIVICLCWPLNFPKIIYSSTNAFCSNNNITIFYLPTYLLNTPFAHSSRHSAIMTPVDIIIIIITLLLVFRLILQIFSQ